MTKEGLIEVRIQILLAVRAIGSMSRDEAGGVVRKKSANRVVLVSGRLENLVAAIYLACFLKPSHYALGCLVLHLE